MKPILALMLSLSSALAMAQAPSGKWTGNAAPNLGDPARCTPNMAFELVVADGKLTGKLDDTFTVVNPIRCGYGNIPLKR